MKLNAAQVFALIKPVKGNGGFQSYIRELQMAMRFTVTLDLTAEQRERLTRYAKRYGEGGYQGRLLMLLGEGNGNQGKSLHAAHPGEHRQDARHPRRKQRKKYRNEGGPPHESDA